MPESPEVEAFTQFFADRATGRLLTDAELIDPRIVKTPEADASALVGRRVGAVIRRGKYIDIDLEGRHLLMNFGKTGWAVWRHPRSSPPDAGLPVVARLRFEGDEGFDLTDAGAWAGLALWFVGHSHEVAGVAALGPDPAGTDFTRDRFDAGVLGRRKQVKAILQDQPTFAGIGNAYSDEIVHLARISPVVHAAVLSDADLDRLFSATVTVMGSAMAERRGIPIERLKAAKVASMRVHGRSGEACPVCGDTIRDARVSGASAQYCPTCQTGGLVL